MGTRRMGIVGLGAIGSELARMCLSLDMSVCAFDPYAPERPDGVRMTDLYTLAAESDFISVHVPSADETVGMLDSAFFAAVKRGAFLVNCSDYRIAQPDALIDALSTGKLGGAALDVFETEPIAPDSPLLKLDNVVLTPHLGGATEETVRRHSRMMVDDLLRFADGRRPRNLVNPEVWQADDV